MIFTWSSRIRHRQDGDSALGLAQVEEQLLLIGRGAHLHQGPRAQDVFLDRRLDPPHGISGEAEAFFRLEALDRLHQADIALRDRLRDRSASRSRDSPWRSWSRA